jgi:hypothetical protein
MTKQTVCAVAALLAALCLAAEAGAVPPILTPPSGRPFEPYGGLGAAFMVKPSPGIHQFKLVQGFAWHFLRRQAAGPAVALELQEGFGGGLVSFVVGPKFKWDFQVVRSLALYAAPYLQLGVGVASAKGDPGSAFNLQLGGEAKLILAQRWVVYWRPIQLDFYIAGDTVITYDMIFGGGVIF